MITHTMSTLAAVAATAVPSLPRSVAAAPLPPPGSFATGQELVATAKRSMRGRGSK